MLHPKYPLLMAATEAAAAVFRRIRLVPQSLLRLLLNSLLLRKLVSISVRTKILRKRIRLRKVRLSARLSKLMFRCLLALA
jgi:hypothetical protein